MKLHKFQKEGVQFLKAPGDPVRFLFDDMGLGKTVQACFAAAELNKPVLVVSPKSPTCVWKEHLRKLTKLQPDVIKRPRDFRWPEKGEAIICTYPQLSWLHQNEKNKSAQMRLKEGPSEKVIVVFDEAHALKGLTNRATQGKELTQRCLEKGGLAWALTGTPLPCSPLDLWGLLTALGRETVFDNFDHFLKHFGGRQIAWDSCLQQQEQLVRKFGYTIPQIYQYNKVLRGPLSAGEAASYTGLDTSFIFSWRKIIRREFFRKNKNQGERYVWRKIPPGGSVLPLFKGTALRRLRSEVLSELPNIQHRIFKVEASDIPAFTRRKVTAAVEYLQQRTQRNIHHIQLTDMTVILQDAIESEHLFSALRLLAETKISILSDIVEEHEQTFRGSDDSVSPLAVCSEYRKPIEWLATRDRWGAIIGGMVGSKKEDHVGQTIRNLNQRKLFGIGFTAAGEEGITLTACHRLVKVSSSLSPSKEEQREARVHRFGQTKGVLVDHLVVNHGLDLFALRLGASKAVLARVALQNAKEEAAR